MDYGRMKENGQYGGGSQHDDHAARDAVHPQQVARPELAPQEADAESQREPPQRGSA